VVYGGGKFLAINRQNAACSTDGISWTGISLPSSEDWSSVAYGDGRFVVVSGGRDKFTYSIDGGVTWKSESLPRGAVWTSIAFYRCE
jgi:hypothetical protein